MKNSIEYSIIRTEEHLGWLRYEASQVEDNRHWLEQIRIANNTLFSLKHCREEYKDMERFKSA